jgi:hypothetical protein
VPALAGVEVAESLDGAPTKWKIEDIPVAECPDVRAKVECRAGKNRLWEDAVKGRELVVEPCIMVAVVFVETGRPNGKSSCRGGVQ